MANIPEKCSRCRAPIDWDDGAAFTKCEFCGFKNYLTNYDQTKIYKDSKKLKIFNFKDQINSSLKNSLGFFESKAKSTKNLAYKNKRIFIYIILAGVFTSIAIPSIKNYSNFVANKRETKKLNEKIIKEDQISGSNKLIVQDSKEEKIIDKKKKERPQWMVEKIKGCTKYKTRKQIEYCIDIYSPYGNPVPKELKKFIHESNLINLKHRSTKSWELEIELRCSFYENEDDINYCLKVYSPYKSASIKDKKNITIIESKFNDGMNYMKKGFAQYNKGNYKNALVYADGYLELFPNDGLALSDKGVLYFYLNDYKKSIEVFTNALEIDPNHNWAYYWRAEAFFEQGKYINAIQDLKKHLLIVPNDKEAKKLLKKAKRKI